MVGEGEHSTSELLPDLKCPWASLVIKVEEGTQTRFRDRMGQGKSVPVASG